MDKVVNLAVSSLLTLNMTAFAAESGTFDAPNLDPKQTLDITQPVITQSKFEEKYATQSAKIEFEK